MESGTQDSVIRYTLDGSDPSPTNGFIYENPFDLEESAIVKAVAVDSAGNSSLVTSTSISITHPTLDMPMFSLEPGVHIGAQSVELVPGDDGVEILYTLDGSMPTRQNGTRYSGPITLEHPSKLRAIAVRRGFINSEIASANYWIYGSETHSEETISLGTDDVMIIEDEYFVHRGDIRLEGNARLVIRNSMVYFDKDYAFQFSLEANGTSRVELVDSSIANSCTGSLNWAFFDNSSLSADGVDHADGFACNTWNFVGGESQFDVTNWQGFSGTVCNQSRVSVSDSHDMEVEFCLPNGLTIDRSFPLELDDFSFGSGDDPKMEFHFEAHNSSVDGWGLNLLPGSDITIRDTPSVTFGIIAGSPWDGLTVEVEGLRIGHFDDRTWTVGDATLRLVNTYVYGWEPNAFGTTTLVIRDSIYSGSSVNSADGRYVIENSQPEFLRAGERVQMTVRDSVIPGDVIAAEDSQITLINCQVGGDAIASGNGRIVLVNTTIDGEFVQSEDGEVVIQEP